MARTLRVVAEDNYVTVPVRVTTTAEEVLKQAATKLQLHGDYALFLRAKNCEAPFRERKLAGFEPVIGLLGADSETVEVILQEQTPLLPFEDPSLVEVAHIGNAIREGTLKVRGKAAWKDKYCLLDSQCIYFAKSQKALLREFTRIKLDSSKVRAGDEVKNGKNSFELATPHKTYVLRGNNAEDRAKWMQSISKQTSAYLEKKAFSSLNDEVRQAELSHAESDARILDLQTECLRFPECVCASHSDLLASFLPSDLQELLTALRQLQDNPRAFVVLPEVTEPRCKAAVDALSEARLDSKSRAAQWKQRELVEAALRQVSEVALEAAPRSDSQLQTDLLAVPGLHLLAAVRRNHKRSLEALRLAVE